jgi:propanol-preferring alcohol dehydrogenase
VGHFAPEITIDTFLCARKHLSILWSYGGNLKELKKCLTLISEGRLRPQVVKGNMDDFPEVLDNLHNGKIKSRIALVP